MEGEYKARRIDCVYDKMRETALKTPNYELKGPTNGRTDQLTIRLTRVESWNCAIAQILLVMVIWEFFATSRNLPRT